MSGDIVRRNAIPTNYRCAQFRSRLEAKWASFFDHMGWVWEYEPLDLSGYIPDFILTNFHKPLLVEIKPEIEFEALIPHAKKIVESGWSGEFMICGAVLFKGETWDGLSAGALFERYTSESENIDIPSEYPAHAVIGCGVLEDDQRGCNRLGIVHEEGSYHCRRCGAYDGNICCLPPDIVRSAWNRAGASVQWKPR